MSEGPGKCDTALRKRIIELLDPIINSGIPTPTPISKPIESVDIDKCIDNVVAQIEATTMKALNNDNVYTVLKENTSLTFEELSNSVDNFVTQEVIKVTDKLTANWFQQFIDPLIQDHDDLVFKSGSKNNTRPLLIPMYAFNTSPLKVSEYEYLDVWSLYKSFINLNIIKFHYMKQLAISVARRDLLLLKNKSVKTQEQGILIINTQLKDNINSKVKILIENEKKAKNLYSIEEQNKPSNLTWDFLNTFRILVDDPKSNNFFSTLYTPQNILNINEINNKLLQCINK
jgi:hypothetical protein